MASVAVIGGGICGMLSAMLLARDGHHVTVIERDEAPPPPDASGAWSNWERTGVGQFRQLHLFNARFRKELRDALPEVLDAMDEIGALRINPFVNIPEPVRGPLRRGDGRFECVTARRPVAEAAVAHAASRAEGLTVRRGIAVDGLLSDVTGGAPHVTGVRLGCGEELRADLVIDAAGRRSPLPRLLDAIGATGAIDEVEESGFVYYGRYFRSDDGSLPPAFGGLLQPYTSLSVLTLPADHGTWGVGVIASAKDKALRAARHADTWTRIVSAYPMVAHWLDGEPLTDVEVMAKIPDRRRCLVIDGAPVVTGVVAVADAWACTNPSLGRGAAMGLMHAVALRDHVREVELSDPTMFAKTWDEHTDETLLPYYDDTVGFDRHRLAQIEAEIDGRPYEPDDPGFHLGAALRLAAPQDPELLRDYLDVAMLLRRGADVLAEPGVAERALALAAGAQPAPGPSRRELVDLIAA